MTTTHCREYALEEMGILWYFGLTFTKLHTTMFTTVLTILLRTKLKNCIQAASPCFKVDLNILGELQRSATRATQKS